MRKSKMHCCICKVVVVLVLSYGVAACGGGGGAHSGAADALDLPGSSGAVAVDTRVDYPVVTKLYRIDSCESTPVCFGPDEESNVTASGDNRSKDCSWDCAAEYKEFSNRAVRIGFWKRDLGAYVNGVGWVSQGICWAVLADSVLEQCE